jgi:tRNA C32,U32 (ribose-2'-O)-methylase TrmJ
MFGPERSGLDNDAISLADAIVTAPVNPSFASLSLPQTVLLVGYEWLQARGSQPSLGRATKCDGPAAEGLDLSGTRQASRAELLALFEHLESELDRMRFPASAGEAAHHGARHPQHVSSHGRDRAGRPHLARESSASLSGSNRRKGKGEGS